MQKYPSLAGQKRGKMKDFIGLVVSGLLAGGSYADAIDIGKIYGHEITLAEQDYEKILKVDGREMHRNAIILFEELTTVSGVPIIIGSSSGGGNACDGSPFVISLPIDGKAKLDGPIDSCATMSHDIEKDKIIFSTPNLPGKGQDKWQWTANEGLKKAGSVAFKASDNSGWNALREQTISYPWDVFDNVEISAQIKQLLGSDFHKYQTILTGMGSGEYSRGDYFGQSCTPHSCTFEEAILYLSYSDKKVYAAYKLDGQKIKVFPVVKEWPDKAKAELRNWSRKWK